MKTASSNHKRANLIALVLMLLASTAMLGDVLSLPALKGLGLASGMAPYTKVFCQAKTRDGGKHFETFAADFHIHYSTPDGNKHTLQITPEIYQNLNGPYQRRNVYGAVLAYGPAMSKDMQDATLHYALENPGNIPAELGLPANASNISVTMSSRTRNANDTWTFTPKRHP